MLKTLILQVVTEFVLTKFLFWLSGGDLLSSIHGSALSSSAEREGATTE